MKVLFFSMKGGQGKTTLAIGYAQYSNAVFITNDFESGTPEIYGDLFAPGQIKIIRPGELYKSKIKNEVYDFGGWNDIQVVETAKSVNLCVVPLYYQSMADLTPAIKTLQALAKFNDNIILVINNTDKKDTREAKAYFEKYYPNLKVFIVNKSKFITQLANENKTVFALADESGLKKYMTIELREQITQLYNFISDYSNE